jgi:kelch-like protein 10
MENKRLSFFGDSNKVMIMNLQNETWQVKTIQPSGCEFLYYSAAVTLPNGDSLITGGGSSSNVYQY